MVTLHTVSALHSNVLEWSGYLSEELWNIVIAMEQLKNVGTSQSQAPSSAVLMQQSLNKLTGQVEWIVVRQDDPEGTADSLNSSSCSIIFIFLLSVFFYLFILLMPGLHSDFILHFGGLECVYSLINPTWPEACV